ncbi:Nif3-like dinuclear metal center hexameric protein [Hydrogenimonas thermophila]|uniref:Nif3-like dinuclear metal center hexameric protein n=1 Tax=Hydrogenimonas thermophila TaxID=223786 RepID=UPI002936DA91|nr:Nif3-like dinuclear metal center hexameric protein [Hydrogenimonas thermophila]WOE69532.1 Nif3-like dinuclear metal center hexameric protein [Hydrogenimonas thermophila]WOE72046.1 Nif3-like dinuclear metal center hexameric protein [Hydrogenimonas thermophila]
MRVGEIYDILDSLSPFELQEKWDNSGLLLGSKEQDARQIVLSVDIDFQMIEEADENTLFILHHPLIFSGLKRLLWNEYPANLLKKMICKNHAMIAMHTNFDQTHLNSYVFSRVLGFEDFESQGFVCKSVGEWNTDELLKHIKESLGLKVMRIVGYKDTIKSIALTTGAGASLMDNIDAELFLTGDIKYHDAMKAISKGLMLADIGHFESERYFANALGEHLKNLPIPVIIAQSINPYSYI